MQVKCGDILVIEDNDDIRDTIRDVLEIQGFAVRTAANGEEGLRLVESSPPCLVFLDLMMPVMDGWEFLEHLRSGQGRAAAIPVTVVSGALDQGDVESRYGVRVLRKPVDIDALVDTANRYCGRGAG